MRTEKQSKGKQFFTLTLLERSGTFLWFVDSPSVEDFFLKKTAMRYFENGFLLQKNIFSGI